MGDETWDENRYKNWVRGAKGLEFLQEGLTDFVGSKAPLCRDQQLQSISSLGSVPQCNQCTSQNLLPDHANSKQACNIATCIEQSSGNCFGSKPRGRRKCPNGVCSKLYDAIVHEHRNKSPLWKSTDPSTWCSDPSGWSYAKCFQSTPGSALSAQDTDAAGLLSFLVNSRLMQPWLACTNMGIQNKCFFQEAKGIRNKIMHKAKMELDDQTLSGYLDIFIAVLQDPKCLATYVGSQDAVKKLTQLKSKQIHISQWDENKIRKIREEALSEIEEGTQEAKKQINDAASAVMADINTTKTGAMQQLEELTITRLSDVNKVTAEKLQEIECAKVTSLSDMGGKTKEALQGIHTTTSIGVTAVKKTKSDSLHEMKDATTSWLSDVNKAKAEAVKEIKDTTSSGVSDVDRKRTKVIQEIEEAKTNIVEELIYKRQQIENSKPDGRQPTTSLDAHDSKVISDEPRCETKKGKVTEFFEKITFRKYRRRKSKTKHLALGYIDICYGILCIERIVFSKQVVFHDNRTAYGENEKGVK